MPGFYVIALHIRDVLVEAPIPPFLEEGGYRYHRPYRHRENGKRGAKGFNVELSLASHVRLFNANGRFRGAVGIELIHQRVQPVFMKGGDGTLSIATFRGLQ